MCARSYPVRVTARSGTLLAVTRTTVAIAATTETTTATTTATTTVIATSLPAFRTCRLGGLLQRVGHDVGSQMQVTAEVLNALKKPIQSGQQLEN